MKLNTSLGDLITALYDVVGESDDQEHESDDIVAECTIDVLLRQRRQRLVATLVKPLGATRN